MTNNANWQWHIPEYFNIGAACTDAHLGSDKATDLAMIVADDRSGISSATFAQLADNSGRFAQLLRNNGIAVGERVLIRLPNSLDFPITFLGTLKSGAIAVPSSTLLVAEEVGYLAQDSEARALVVHKSMWSELRETLNRIPSLEQIFLAGDEEMPPAESHLILHDLPSELSRISEPGSVHPTRADDPAYLVYTSGTTGHPKGVLHAHRALLGRTPSNTHWFDFRPGDRILHSGRFNWTYVLGTGLMDPLFNGHTVVVHEGKSDATLWPRLIREHACTIFIGVPTIYRQIIEKTDYLGADLPSLRHCMSAGETLSEELLTAWRERFGLAIFEGMGMSECSYYISQHPRRPVRSGSIGCAQPGHDVHLLGSNYVEVACGEEGMIALPEQDPGLFLGYWRQPEETARTYRNGFFLTGDYARRDEDGYLWFAGRRDDIINSFGYRISPYEIERVMKRHPAVAECIAIGQQIDREKTLIAICVIPESGQRPHPEALLEYGKLHLASYKRPRLVHLMQSYPRTKNGKVMRQQLKLMLSEQENQADVETLSR
ncbi:MAG: acyl-CoA synthetase [Gammaproteobacteria bacterium]|nr:acyl-CoA synthetase [Gammaproteobacteria bacterium]